MSTTDERRLVRRGFVVAGVLATVQTAVHLVNYWTARNPLWDANAEKNPMALLSAVVIAAAAWGAFGQRREVRSRRPALLLGAILAFLALDEVLRIHERVGWRAARLLGLSGDWDSVIWPVLYVPIMLTVVALLVLLARRSSRTVRNAVYTGLGLLATAVLIEVASAPFSTESTASGAVHAIAGGVEEASELAGWLVVATALAVRARFGLRADVEHEAGVERA